MCKKKLERYILLRIHDATSGKFSIVLIDGCFTSFCIWEKIFFNRKNYGKTALLKFEKLINWFLVVYLTKKNYRELGICIKSCRIFCLVDSSAIILRVRRNDAVTYKKIIFLICTFEIHLFIHVENRRVPNICNL